MNKIMSNMNKMKDDSIRRPFLQGELDEQDEDEQDELDEQGEQDVHNLPSGPVRIAVVRLLMASTSCFIGSSVSNREVHFLQVACSAWVGEVHNATSYDSWHHSHGYH